MSYYGVSVIITILITSLLAFYLLYKAKELNLGILISITTGSIVLGFSFSPAFQAILGLLSNNISINKKIALILSLFAVLFIFLLFICILSFLISIAIPKKFSSIDCGIYIDNFIASIKRITSGIWGKISAVPGKMLINLRNNVKNTYNLKNKLKKPVDTKQIIDTMGIEKSENGISKQENNAEPAGAFANILAYLEPNRHEVPEALEITETVPTSESINISEELEAVESIAAAIETDIVNDFDVSDDIDLPETDTLETDIFDGNNTTDETEPVEDIIDESDTDDISDMLDEIVDSVASADKVEEEDMDFAEIDNTSDSIIEETEEDSDYSNMVAAAFNEVVASDAEDFETEVFDEVQDNSSEAVEPPAIPIAAAEEISAQSLVVRAFECKDNGRKDLAVEYYMEALQCEPDKEMIFWIVLDVCTLYKQLGLIELAKSILEGLVQKYESIIQPEIKEEIIKNLK